ncbi:MAG: DUF4139 domain-containing protein [Armatimonadetes bacterium]|nr:DUF4139 domain-containing protein [Armatimonadota bacterium]
MSSAIAMMVASVSAPSNIELTIYNQNFGLVKEVRAIDLVKGRQDAKIEGVAQLIESDSVTVRGISGPAKFTVLEQNYQYDLISPWAILDKAVGSRIYLVRILPNGEKEQISGILLSSPTAVVNTAQGNSYTYNGLVMKTDQGRILLSPSGEIVVDTLPDGLISKPTLVWDIDSDTAGRNEVEISYLTGGLTWESSYVINLDNPGRVGDFKGWVTLNNTSGITYKDAKLKLLAGEVARAQAKTQMMQMNRPRAGTAGSPGGFVEEQFADYHLYTLERPATVRNKEQKQVSLLEAKDIKVTKRLIVDAMMNYGSYRIDEGEIGTGPIKPLIKVEFENTEKNQMGMALPTGKVKVFQRDKSGSLQLLGEDRIDHTPKNEKVSLNIGRAFDIVAERKRDGFEWIRRGGAVHGARQTITIEVRNRKEVAETVEVIERYWGEWKIAKANLPYESIGKEGVRFNVTLGANEVKKVTYTVEQTW